MTSQKSEIVFRVDASTDIGGGHVWRCIAIAIAFERKGFNCIFICRALSGNMNSLIRKMGFEVCELPSPKTKFKPKKNSLAHAHLLGVDWKQMHQKHQNFC